MGRRSGHRFDVESMWGSRLSKKTSPVERENGKCRRAKAKGATGDQAGDFPFTLLSSFNAYAGGTFQAQTPSSHSGAFPGANRAGGAA